MADWQRKVKQKKGTPIPDIPEEQKLIGEAELVVIEKISALRMAIYNLLPLNTLNNNKRRTKTIKDFYTRPFRYIFQSELIDCPDLPLEIDFEVHNFDILQQTIGEQWWIRTHSEHKPEVCSIPCCGHKEQTKGNQPMRVRYNRDKNQLKISLSFTVLPFITLATTTTTVSTTTAVTTTAVTTTAPTTTAVSTTIPSTTTTARTASSEVNSEIDIKLVAPVFTTQMLQQDTIKAE